MDYTQIVIAVLGFLGVIGVQIIISMTTIRTQREERRKEQEERDKKEQKEQAEKDRKQEEALACIMGALLDVMCNQKIAAGEIEPETLRQIHDLYGKYKLYNGNGYVDNLLARVNQLPIKN